MRCSLMLVLSACVGTPELHNRLCPCSRGWVCADGRCVEEELVCPGVCGDKVQCPHEACDDGDTSDCTIACNANCTGAAPPHNSLCVQPTIAFAEESLEVYEVPPGSELESKTYLSYAHSTNAYYEDIVVNFGTSNDVNEGKLVVRPNNGRIVIPAGETVSEPIALELLPNTVSHPVRRVYVALLAANLGDIGAPAVFTLFVRNSVEPTVTRTLPESDAVFVAVDTSVEIEFSAEMDPVTTAAAFTIDPPVDGEISWSTDKKLLIFEPTTPLEVQQSYVVILAEAASAAGVTLDYGFGFETFDVAVFMTLCDF